MIFFILYFLPSSLCTIYIYNPAFFLNYLLGIICIQSFTVPSLCSARVLSFSIKATTSVSAQPTSVGVCPGHRRNSFGTGVAAILMFVYWRGTSLSTLARQISATLLLIHHHHGYRILITSFKASGKTAAVVLSMLQRLILFIAFGDIRFLNQKKLGSC